ncbi:MAG: GNAT family N-acetyltransferase [Fidelibacterota bacterium]
MTIHKKDSILIKSFKSEYTSDFYALNKEWIEESWHLEKSDINDLSNPQRYIIDKGGEVFFAIKNDTVIATAAMVSVDSKVFELAKMTVSQECRGLGVANQLMDRCIDFAKENHADQIVLITNSALVIARNLYDKYGFKEIVLDSDKYGDRGNVKMNLYLGEKSCVE